MELVDSHCHLDMLPEPHHKLLDELMENALNVGVKYFLCVSVNLTDFPNVLASATHYPNVYATVGVHPNEEVVEEPTVDTLIKLANHPKVIALGETGLDYYRSTGDLEWQRERFRVHIKAAKQLGIPLVIHSRQAPEDTIKILKEENAKKVRGVMHCFTEDWKMAEQALELGFYISFSGIVSFKNAASVQEVAKKMPIERMLIETDSPYLAPEPFRGQKNQPAYVRQVAEAVARLRNISVEEVAERTTSNFFELFKKAKKSVSNKG